MKQIRKVLTIFLCLIFLISGCWDYVEVEELTLVRTIAIDYLPERRAPYLVTLAISLPADIAGEKSGSGGGSPTQLFSAVGATLNLAIEQASLNLSRRLFFSHAELILIGEEAAKHGLLHILDFISNHPQVRFNVDLLITKGFARDVMTTTERLEVAITEEMIGMINQARYSSESDPLQAFEFLQKLVTPGQDAYTALLLKGPPLEEEIAKLKDEQKPGGQEESTEGGAGGANGGGKSEGGSSGSTEDIQEILTMAGLAAFQNDKLVGFLNSHETRGLLWFLGKTNRTFLAIENPEKPSETISLHVARVQTKIKPHLENGQISFSVEVITEGDIRSQTGNTEIFTPEMINKINSAKAGAIKQEMEKAMRKMQELKVDLVGFGTILYRHDPETFRLLEEKWPEEFSKLKVNIVVTSEIRRTGMQSHPARLRR